MLCDKLIPSYWTGSKSLSWIPKHHQVQSWAKLVHPHFSAKLNHKQIKWYWLVSFSTFSMRKKAITNIHLQVSAKDLPVKCVKWLCAIVYPTLIWLFLGVDSDMYFQTVWCQKCLSTARLVANKCIFSCKLCIFNWLDYTDYITNIWKHLSQLVTLFRNYKNIHKMNETCYLSSCCTKICTWP